MKLFAQYNHMHVCIFYADEEVTGGSVKVSLMYKGFVPIHTEHTFDLCELLQDMKKSCPVPKGIFDVTMDIEVPKDVLAVSRRERLFLILNNSLASFL